MAYISNSNQELFSRSHDLEYEMKHSHSLLRSPLWRFLVANKTMSDFLVLRIAFVQVCVYR